MAVQRFMAAKTLREAQRIAVAGPVFVMCFFSLGAMTGIAVIYWYRDCDPVLSGAIKSYDQIVPLYITQRLSEVTALRGLFLAGVVGASTRWHLLVELRLLLTDSVDLADRIESLL
ncbi:hypothetical protein MTO96_052134 [Rhipicephalus appendiculatus]